MRKPILCGAVLLTLGLSLGEAEAKEKAMIISWGDVIEGPHIGVARLDTVDKVRQATRTWKSKGVQKVLFSGGYFSCSALSSASGDQARPRGAMEQDPIGLGLRAAGGGGKGDEGSRHRALRLADDSGRRMSRRRFSTAIPIRFPGSPTSRGRTPGFSPVIGACQRTLESITGAFWSTPTPKSAGTC